MNNFGRAFKDTLRYRWTVAGTFVSSCLVAILWGGNIGALYPVIQVAFQGRSLQTWLDNEIQQSQQRIAGHQAALRALDAAGQKGAVETAQRRELNFDLQAEQSALKTREFARPWVNRLFPRDPFQTVVLIVSVLIVATMIKGVFVFANAICVAFLEQQLVFDLRDQFYRQALQMDLGAFGDERTSGMLSRFNADIGCLTAGIKNLFGSAIREPLKMIACLFCASFVSWRLLVFSLILTPLIGLTIRKLAGAIKRANRRVLEEITQLYGVLSETFNGIQTVQAYTLEANEQKKFHKVATECFQKGMRIAFYSSLTKPMTETMGIGMISLGLTAGAYLVLNQETHLLGIRMCERPLDVPSLLIFYGLLIGTIEPARKLSEIFNSIQAGVAAADRLYPLLDQQPAIRNPAVPQSLPAPHHRLVFDKVSFHYVPGTPVLNEIDLTVNFGETIAIVGPNGCGKSTLVQMIPRFFDPVHGSIRLDHRDLREASLHDLRHRIGLVTQQSVLFDDTVFHNIQCGRLDATDEEVLQAARQARAHKFIVDRLSNGYQTIVGAGGSRLSGGQRQRIALARAILRDPEILILDEATSQIDLESEQLIHQALEDFARGRTVFIITHRMSTLSLADRILVMNAGRVEDLGTHQELLHRCPLYQRLSALQFQQSA